MPGMMDTILNVGLNPDCVRELARKSGNARAAWEAYRHVLVTFGETVGGMEQQLFADLVAEWMEEHGVTRAEDLDAAALDELCRRLREAIEQHTGRDFRDDPFAMLDDAIEAVFRSWNSERAIAYRRHHQMEGQLGTAVNVQMMCPSEVSGVMFTAHPVNPAIQQIIIEASFGLGEAVVLGKVTPDRFVLSRPELEIVERQVSDKKTIVPAAEGATQAQARRAASLTDEQLHALACLGLRVEEYFKMPCDIEWGLSQGKFYLLQARAIKRVQAENADDMEQLRLEEIARLRGLAAPEGTVWSRYNLAEILTEPTPMTWDIVRRFMSGRGGFGQMYRDLGFDPDPALDDIGIFDLVCGRPYCNLSREPKLQFRQLPFEHPFARLKENPQLAMYPVPSFNAGRASWRFWLLIPIIFGKLFLANLKQKSAARDFAEAFGATIVPAFLAEVAAEESTDLQSLDSAALVQRLHHWTQRALFDFARDSLKPTALAAITMSNLERTLTRLSSAAASAGGRPAQLSEADAQAQARDAVRRLVLRVRPDAETDLPGALHALARGQLDREQFLLRFGHRGHQEMELANPRWSEAREQIPSSSVHDPKVASRDPQQDNLDFHSWSLPPHVVKALEHEVNLLHTFVALREAAKHHLMRGYALIRRILVELDSRYHLHGGIFYLTLEELPALLAGRDFSEEIGRRQRRRSLLLKIEVPPVLFSDDLEAIGRPPAAPFGNVLQGVPLSAGIAEGPALVLDAPQAPPVADGFILVCPSTDPAWLPLFVRARAVVMETGGMLSHGAIVAREFGLPAVAGLPEIHRRLRTGQHVRVDGSTGKVNVVE
jgi:pyruvate,water dikinase